MKANLSFLSYCFLGLAGGFLVSANLLDSCYACVICALVLTISIILFCFDRLSNRIGFAIFMACLFTFQIAGIALPLLLGDPEWLFGLSVHEYIVACNCIYLSSFVLIVTTSFLEGHKIVWRNSSGLKIRFLEDSSYNIFAVQRWAFIICLVSTAIATVGEFRQMEFAIANGYMSMYGDYTISAIINRMEIVSRTSMFIGLAANPSKKRAWAYFMLGLPISVMTIIEGSRTWFVVYILFYIYYFYTFNNWEKKEITIKEQKRKNKRLLLIAVALVVILSPVLYIYGYSRVDRTIQGSMNPIMLILQFFSTQGGSVKIIGWAERYNGELPGICYSLGSIIDRIQGNSYPAYSLESALEMNRFGNIMSYLDSPYNYTVLHYGVGSSYIAEVYYDFSYFGVVIINIILSCIFLKLSSYKSTSVLVKSFIFMMFCYLMMIPRGALLQPFDNIFSLSCLLTMFLVFTFSKRKVGAI